MKKELQVLAHEERYKTGNYIVRCGVMFIQQSSLNQNRGLLNDMKCFADLYNGVFSMESPLSFYTTAELKAEIKRRSGRSKNKIKVKWTE